jgi:hypothetical protein
MAGRVPAIYARAAGADGRNEPGHDGETNAYVSSTVKTLYSAIV